MTLADGHFSVSPATDDIPEQRGMSDEANWEKLHEEYGREVVVFNSARTREERDQAFAAIVRSHQDVLTRFCSAALDGDRYAAEDAVAETFAAAWTGLENIDNPRAVRKWLVTVAKRRCIRNLRLRSREVPAETEREPDVHTDTGDHERRRVLEWLDLLAAMLPPDRQRFHDLCFRQGLRGEGLAAALGIPREERDKVDKKVHRHVAWLHAAVEAEIVVRESVHEKPCRTLAKILETADHTVRPSEVMPIELGKEVVKHINKCQQCGSALERGRLRYMPWAILPLLYAFGLLNRPSPRVEPASYQLADNSQSLFGDWERGLEHTSRGTRRQALGWAAGVGLLAVLALVALFTGRPETGSGPRLSLADETNRTSWGLPTSQPTGSAEPDSPEPDAPGSREHSDRNDPTVATTPTTSLADTGSGGVVPPTPSPTKPPPPGMLAVTPKSINLPLYATTATVTLSAGSDMSWTATTTDPAVTATPASGTVSAGKNRQIKVTVNRNSTAKPDTELVVTSASGQRVPVAVHWPTPGKVGTTTSRVDLGHRGTTATFSVTAAKGNLTWSASSPHRAVTVSPASGSLTAGKGALVTVRLTRPINTGGDVPLRVTTPDGQQVTVTVRWLATPGTLRTSTDAVHIWSSGSRASFDVSVVGGTNTWTATLSAPGCAAPTCQLSISPTSGSGTAQLTVTLWPHPSSGDPAAHGQGTVTLTTPDGQRVTVRVTWDPYEPG